MVQRCKFSIELKNFPPDLSGEPEQLICEAFGHSSVKVTETYLKNFKYEEIKKANDAIILYVSKNGKKRA